MNNPALARLESLLARVQERAKAPRVKALSAPEPVAPVALQPEAQPVAPQPVETPVAAPETQPVETRIAPPVETQIETPAAPVELHEEPEAITQFPPAMPTPQSAPPAPAARIAEVIGDEAVTLRPAAPSMSPESIPETATTRAPPLTDVPGTRPSVLAPSISPIPPQRPVSLRDLVPEPAPEPEGLPETEVFTLSDSPPPPKPVAVERFEAKLEPAPAAVKVIAPAAAQAPATFRAMLLRSLALRPR